MEGVIARANELVPRAKPPCPKCKGTGSYYDPPLEQQEREAKRGEREFVAKRVCTCILED